MRKFSAIIMVFIFVLIIPEFQTHPIKSIQNQTPSLQLEKILAGSGNNGYQKIFRFKKLFHSVRNRLTRFPAKKIQLKYGIDQDVEPKRDEKKFGRSYVFYTFVLYLSICILRLFYTVLYRFLLKKNL